MTNPDQDERLHRIVAWACNTHGPQSFMVDGEKRPHCSECGQKMLAVPYLRESMSRV